MNGHAERAPEIPAGTRVVLLIDSRIDTSAVNGRVFPAQILERIPDAAGPVIVPAGTMAPLAGNGRPGSVELTVASLTINGRLCLAVSRLAEDLTADAGVGAPLGTLLAATIRRLAELEIAARRRFRPRAALFACPRGPC